MSTIISKKEKQLLNEYKANGNTREHYKLQKLIVERIKSIKFDGTVQPGGMKIHHSGRAKAIRMESQTMCRNGLERNAIYKHKVTKGLYVSDAMAAKCGIG